MRALFVTAVAVLAVVSGVLIFTGVRSPAKVSLADVERFHQWRARFGKLYSSPSESQFRMDVVVEKMKKIDAWNAEYTAYLQANGLPTPAEPMFGSMPWDDLTEAEFKKSKTGLRADARKTDEIEDKITEEQIQEQVAAAPAPSLGQSGYTHKIRDQGECGSCWAFSTVATLERHYHKMKGTQIDLSHQELVDCSTADFGCDGGWPTETYWYVLDNGIQNAATYPYYGSQYYCERDETKRIWFDKTYSVREIAFTTSRALAAANNQIVAGTAVHSAGKLNNLVGSSIYDAASSGECSKQVDHAVNIQTSGKDAKGKVYVVIQNSWSTNWGDKGFMKVYPCGANKLWGATNILSHTTNVDL